MKEKSEKMLKKPNYLTVPAALKELEKIVMIRQLDGVYRLDHAVTATQKTILDAFGLNEGNVRYQAKEIGNGRFNQLFGVCSCLWGIYFRKFTVHSELKLKIGFTLTKVRTVS